MRRLGRWLRNFLTVLSLLLCAAIVVLWVRSYWRVDSLMLFRVKYERTTVWIDHHTIMTLRSGPVYEADSHRGSLRLLFLYDNGGCYVRGQYPALWSCGEALLSSWPPKMAMASDGVIEPWAPAATHWPGVAMESRAVPVFLFNAPPLMPGDPPPPPPPIGYTVHALYTPWAFWTFLTALLPAAAFWRWRRRLSRSSRGLCVACGYSLTGNVTGVCPECGAACKAANPAGASPAAGD
ncbi:MAG TPA: hypothetical protein VGI81_26725 [Tepidisphaeraceae bacterium]